MTPSEYVQAAIRTEAEPPKTLNVSPRLLHGAMGCCTEAAEMLGNLKKAMFYGNDVDLQNIKEELGDVFWYAAIICDELRIGPEEIMEMNIRKLKTRYPEKFSRDASDNRDYLAEAKAFKASMDELSQAREAAIRKDS